MIFLEYLQQPTLWLGDTSGFIPWYSTNKPRSNGQMEYRINVKLFAF